MEILINGYVITLIGVLNSENVSEVEMQIMDQLNEKSHLTINIDQLNRLDTSGLYMLYLIKKRAQNLGKTISIKESQNPTYKQALDFFSCS